ncbi:MULTISPECIES: anti-sigma factor [unclassified Mesorhizobium]|uniref:anti-sigma factor family protein n=1 Tax=unclassified Mesorhizobium TaxID=325217 RepID=UPI0003CF3252|nr:MULTISPECIES: anti-sigma factor [unclassified Mesorhizobium]ESY54305.1 anti-sigma factor [Mesorhizobium sp. LNJC374B00]ESY58339.1 anti-sigma factor [Mesorhizobium sp. LNJC372A00]WJI78802.1 anti-sigma factor [Mesorhizobium sp. C374B]WJI85337.1 anti-sigma factor [Mesorhizobium sp. C372A]
MSAHNDGLPEDAAGMNLMLHALIDGELDAAAAMAVERRIAADPKLAAEHARIMVLQGAVARLPKPRVSDEFSARIAALAASSRVEVLRPRAPTQAKSAQTWWSARNFGSFDWRTMAASIMISAVLASGATQWAMQPSVADSFAAGVASGHQRSLLATSPVDVVSSDRHTVKPWLDARLGLSPPAPDMAKDGFALIGGRVEVIGGRAVPALVYRHREHLITLVAEPQNAGAVTDPVDLSEGGFSLVHWSDGAFSYWAISDMERPELDDFVARFRAAVVPG